MSDDRSFDENNGALRAFDGVETAADADADEYSLNDIGLALRIRSEQQ